MEDLLDRIAAGPAEAEDELLRIYADQLILVGDPLGELIVVASDRARHATPELARREDALVAEHAALLRQAIGPFHATFGWRRGLLDILQFRHGGDEPLERVFPILAERREARLLRRLVIGSLEVDGEGDLGPTFAVLATLAPKFPRLVEIVARVDLEAGNPWVEYPISLRDVSPLYAAYPALEVLELDGRNLELGDLMLPNVRRLLATHLRADDARRIVAAELPRLTELELHFDYPPPNIAATFGPLLHREFPRLEALSLALPSVEAQRWLIRELPELPIARHVRRLSFLRGQIDVQCHERLIADRRRYPHLEQLELHAFSLAAPIQQRLRRAWGEVLKLA